MGQTYQTSAGVTGWLRVTWFGTQHIGKHPTEISPNSKPKSTLDQPLHKATRPPRVSPLNATKMRPRDFCCVVFFKKRHLTEITPIISTTLLIVYSEMVEVLSFHFSTGFHPNFPWAKESYTKLSAENVANLSGRSLASPPCRCVVPLWVWLFVDLSIACFFSMTGWTPSSPT